MSPVMMGMLTGLPEGKVVRMEEVIELTKRSDG